MRDFIDLQINITIICWVTYSVIILILNYQSWHTISKKIIIRIFSQMAFLFFSKGTISSVLDSSVLDEYLKKCSSLNLFVPYFNYILDVTSYSLIFHSTKQQVVLIALFILLIMLTNDTYSFVLLIVWDQNYSLNYFLHRNLCFVG